MHFYKIVYTHFMVEIVGMGSGRFLMTDIILYNIMRLYIMYYSIDTSDNCRY